MKVLNKLFLLLLLIPLISANGLLLTNDIFLVNKTNNVDFVINLNLTNSEPFSFKNITLLNSNVGFMSQISELQSGQSILFPMTINSNNDFSGDVRIIGSYDFNIGDSNTTYYVNVTSNGIDRCNINLVQGDSIYWSNNLVGEIKLRNVDTGEYFQTISSQSVYNSKFNDIINFNYQVYKVGLPISQVCNVNIQGKSGLVHNSNFDALLKLNLTILYEPTTINATFPTSSYSLRYDQQAQDLFTIKNTGSRIAKNIRLSGEWLVFDKNNFDLGIGQSINVGYTISPNVIQTNSTNKTHQKSIIIDGNFQTINKSLDVFVQYFDFSFLLGGGIDEKVMDTFVAFYCLTRPDKCPKKVVYLNDSDSNVTITVGKEAYREGLLEEDAFRQEMRLAIRDLAEADVTSLMSLNQTKEGQNVTSDKLSSVENKIIDLTNVGWFFLFCISFTIVATTFYFLILKQKSKKNILDYGDYHKGEDFW